MKASIILMLPTAGLLLVSAVACSATGTGNVSNQVQTLISQAYTITGDEIQTAVGDYETGHNLNLPIYSSGDTLLISGHKDCHIIDMNLLLMTQGGIMRHLPNSCYAAEGSNNDNCDGGATGCSASYHYIWAVDQNGSVCSKCIGHDCQSNDADGYQGVWP